MKNIVLDGSNMEISTSLEVSARRASQLRMADPKNMMNTWKMTRQPTLCNIFFQENTFFYLVVHRSSSHFVNICFVLVSMGKVGQSPAEIAGVLTHFGG